MMLLWPEAKDRFPRTGFMKQHIFLPLIYVYIYIRKPGHADPVSQVSDFFFLSLCFIELVF